MRKDAEPIPSDKRIAVPLPEGIVDPVALKKSLETFAAEVRRRQFGPWTSEELEEIAERQERERQCRDLLYSAA